MVRNQSSNLQGNHSFISSERSLERNLPENFFRVTVSASNNWMNFSNSSRFLEQKNRNIEICFLLRRESTSSYLATLLHVRSRSASSRNKRTKQSVSYDERSKNIFCTDRRLMSYHEEPIGYSKTISTDGCRFNFSCRFIDQSFHEC